MAVPVASLRALAKHRLPNPIKCSSFSGFKDLLAIVHASWDVSVYRIISGQVAFTIKRRDDCEVKCLDWRSDGAMLAVSWSDGTYCIYDGERGGIIGTGRVVSSDDDTDDDWRLDLRPDFGRDVDEDEATINVCSFGWEHHAASALVSNTRLSHEKTIENWASDLHSAEADPQANVKNLSFAALSGALTALDVTKILPRLSSIPAHGMTLAKAGPAGNKFSTAAATDAVFDSHSSGRPSDVQVVLISQDDGVVQVLMDETVKIGTCNVGQGLLRQASHPRSPYHAILSQNDDALFSINFLELPLDTLGGPLLHNIATNTKRMQNLLDYSLHTLRCIEHDFSTGLQLPGRLLNSLSGMLTEQGEGDVSLNLFQLAMAGEFSAPLLEWLTDIVKDTNHKRWDASVNTMYTNIQNHLFINLLPALERLTIAASELHGLATFHEGSSKFDCSAQTFTDVLAATDCLRLVAEKVLLIASGEQKQFRAFSRWLKMQIEIGTAEPYSSGALEAEEREVPSIDFALVLKYIRATMAESRLSPFITTRPGSQQSLSKEDFLKNPAVGLLGFEEVKIALDTHHQIRSTKTDPVKTKPDELAPLINLPTIGAILKARIRIALEKITSWQSRMLNSPAEVVWPLPEPLKVLDMSLVPKDSERPAAAARIIAVPSESPESATHFNEILIRPPSGRGPSNTSSEMLQWPFMEPGRLLDAKFHPANASSILTLFRREEDKYTLLTLHDSPENSTLLHTFRTEDGFSPQNFILGGRENHLVCIVVGNRGREWVVLDLEERSRGIRDTANEKQGAEDLVMTE